eukprot:scaffold1694_cov118-Skeletonema_menzelii.AAC.4
MFRNIATILLLRLFIFVASSASAASINDDDDVGEANKALREESIFAGMHRRLQKPSSSDTYSTFTSTSSSSSSHEPRDLKPDSTKSAKSGSKSAKSKSAKAQCGCETYEAELEALKEEMSTPQWLAVQVGDKCILDMSGDTPTIESSNFHKDTELFTDRPLKFENSTLTSDWFTNFDEIFDDEDGFPNAAMTLVKDDKSVGVVVTAFVNGYIKDGESEGDHLFTLAAAVLLRLLLLNTVTHSGLLLQYHRIYQGTIAQQQPV